MVSTSFFVALQNNNESSANNKLEMLGAPRQIDSPWILASFSAFVSKEVKLSTHDKNKYGEIGSPCRIPQEGSTLP